MDTQGLLAALQSIRHQPPPPVTPGVPTSMSDYLRADSQGRQTLNLNQMIEQLRQFVLFQHLSQRMLQDRGKILGGGIPGQSVPPGTRLPYRSPTWLDQPYMPRVEPRNIGAGKPVDG